MTTTFDFDKVRELLAINYKDEGDDEGEPMMVGSVVVSAVVHLGDGATKSVFLHDGGWDECLGLATRQSDVLREAGRGQ